MNRTTRVSLLASLLALSPLAAARTARADTNDAPAPAANDAPAVETPADAPRPEPDGSLHLLVDSGVYTGASGDGLLAGATVLGRADRFAFGVRGQAAAELFGENVVSASALAGASLPLGGRFRLSLLGEGGIDSYSNVGSRSLFSDDPGASANLPFLGVRASATHRWGLFELGLSAAFADDLVRKDVTYTYFQSAGPGLFSAHPAAVEQATHRVGTDRGSLALTLGTAFDL